MTLSFQDLTDQPQDLALLARFYADVYIPGFPDANERESLENMQAYLALKRAGWYQSNNYHILLAVEDGAPIACSISDYLAEPNAGVLEFLLVDPQQRGRGLGQDLHAATEALLQTDARRAGHAGLSCIAIEMNDPYRVNPADDNMDPFARARLWGRWGYGALGFPYVQPALSADQGAVDYLILGAKPLDDKLRHGFPPRLVRQIVYGYLRWAMRIENPEGDPQFQEMSAVLAHRRAVWWTPFAAYLGTDIDCPFHVQEVRAGGDDFAAAMGVFRRSFPPGPTTIGPQAFLSELEAMSASPPPAYRYHFWAVRQSPESAVAGMLSFFSFPGCGFVGYVAVEPPLRGPRIVQFLLARMEEQLIRDFGDIRGWFMETSLHHSHPRALARLGFHCLVERYAPPSHANLGASDVSISGQSTLGLFYKSCGNDYGVLRNSRAALLDGVTQWLAGVYKVSTPEQVRRLLPQLGVVGLQFRNPAIT